MLGSRWWVVKLNN